MYVLFDIIIIVKRTFFRKRGCFMNALKMKWISENMDTLKKYRGKIIATSNNWDYKVTIYGDGSSSIDYIAKPESGCSSGIYCGIEMLKSHFTSLLRYRKDKSNRSIIPEDWEVIDRSFFEFLGIE